MALFSGVGDAVTYIDTRNFTEPAFVFVIMVVAASRPILELVNMAIRVLARLLPLRNELAMFFVIMSFVPLAGSFITEPAAPPRPRGGRGGARGRPDRSHDHRSEEHTSELQSLMRISYAVFCLKKQKNTTKH